MCVTEQEESVCLQTAFCICGSGIIFEQKLRSKERGVDLILHNLNISIMTIGANLKAILPLYFDNEYYPNDFSKTVN